MSGTLRNVDTFPGQYGQSNPSDDPRSLGNGHNSRPSSPLKFFARAKSKSNDLLKDIAECVLEAKQFIKDTKGEENEDWKTIHSFGGIVNGIREKLARDHMKVVFFGRTSYGKSTVINAMLRNKMLPSRTDHTTHCFLQVEGTETSDGLLLTDGSTEPKSIHSVEQLASVISTMKLKEDPVIRIVWPKEKCRLLKEDVVFIESPGIDVTPDLDKWIDKFCLDADVFVLVGNAESTLMQTEKNLFHKVSSRLSKPNIFILQNRWDVCEGEEDVDELEEQLYTRNVQFLTDKLKVADKEEAKKRIFFVSAEEALLSRLHDDDHTLASTGTLQKNYAKRLLAFADFERAFELCISKSAVQTKFQTHSERGKKITADLKDIMERTCYECLQDCKNRATTRRETANKLERLEKQLSLLTVEIQETIKCMVEDVERNVSFALNAEIKRLSVLVNEFSRPFNPESMLLNVYKKELHNHVEEGLGRNLQQRCSFVLQQAVETTQNNMTDRLAGFLRDKERNELYNTLLKRNFEKAYTLDCRNLCSEFQEDIQFRFSLGITSLMHKFLGSKCVISTLSGGATFIPRPMSLAGTPMTPRAELMQQDNHVLMTVITTFATVNSKSTMGAVLIAGLVLKVAGWKVAAVVGSLYLMECLCWTNKAKERKFKSQYVEYAASKLRLIVDLASLNCRHQVQQELFSTFTRLSNYAEISKDNLKEELLNLDKEIRYLEDILKQSERNKADWLDKEYSGFIEEFLQKSD